MSATQIGATLAVGATTTVLTIPNATNYIVVRATEGDVEIDKEEIEDSEGALATIVTYNSLAMITLELLCKAAATPATDFPKGTQVATDWFVDDCKINRTKAPHSVTVTLRKTDL